MHIGSFSRMAPATPGGQNSLLDVIFSRTLDRYPALKLSYSDGQVGWLPYIIDRADELWQERDDSEFGSSLKVAPSQFIKDGAFFCIPGPSDPVTPAGVMSGPN